MPKPFTDDPDARWWRRIVEESAKAGTIPPDYRAYLVMLGEGVDPVKIYKEALAGRYTAPHAGYEMSSGYSDRNEPEISQMEKFYSRMLGGVYPNPRAKSDY